MAKKMFTFLGTLLVLTMSLAVVSADVEDFSLTVTDGSSSNRLTGANDTTHNFAVTLSNANSSLTPAYVHWRVGSNTNMVLPNNASFNYDTTNDYTVTGFTLTMPYHDSSYVALYADIYTDSTYTTFYGTERTNIYYNNTDYVTPTNVYGCTDPLANNYDSSATVDDNSCTYDSITETFCELDNFGNETGDLELELDVTNNGQGDDDEWNYLDEIVIEVTVVNDGNDDIDDVNVELRIVDENGKVLSKKDLDLDEDEDNLGDIDEDDEETTTFTIDEVPIDLDEGDYKLYVRAYSDGDEDIQCVSESDDFTDDDDTYFEFEVKAADETTIIVKDDIENVKASCGDNNVEVSFMVYNVGDDKEEKVLVTLENSDLGIYEKYVIDNLREGKGKEATFNINIPEELDGTYQKLEIYTYYNWDDDEDEDEESSYKDSSEEEDEDFEMYLEIISCKAPEPTIQANLNSAAKVGENMIVAATIKNNGDDNNFVISASGYESWATLVSIDPQTTTISEDGSQQVTITLSPTTAGAQSFTITTLVDGETHTQSVSVNIAEEETSGLDFGANSMVTYMIIAIVAVLVLIFLVLIVKVSTRRTKVKVADF